MNNICVDFGTCNTVISYFENEHNKFVYNNANGDILIPTTLFFIKDEINENMKFEDLVYKKHYFIGNEADETFKQYKQNDCYFYQFKRFLGMTNKSNCDFINKFCLKYELSDDTIYFFIPINDLTNNDSTNNDSTNNDSTNNDSTNNDSTNNDSTNDSNNNLTNNDLTNNDSTNNDSTNNDSTNNDSTNDSNNNLTNNDSTNDSNNNLTNNDSTNDNNISTNNNHTIKVNIVQLISLFFVGIKSTITNTISNNNIIEALITCPAYFHDLQRQQLQNAVINSGIKIFKICNEPTVALLQYLDIMKNKNNNSNNNQEGTYNITNNQKGTYKITNNQKGTYNITDNQKGTYNNINNQKGTYNITNNQEGTYNITNNQEGIYIIYDLGGGTLDTTVMDYQPDIDLCEVIDIYGNNALGGIDIDNILIENIYEKYNIEKNLSENGKLKMKIKIKNIAEDIKIKLTYAEYYSFFIEEVLTKNNKIIPVLEIKYTRFEFNRLITRIIDKMIEPIIAMSKKHSTKNIIFIGGPTQIPLLQNKVKALLNLNDNIETITESNNSQTTHNNNLQTTQSNNLPIMQSNNLPATCNNNSLLYKTIVASGGSLLHKNLKNKTSLLLLDITPMDIGISDNNQNMTTLVKKHTKIPFSETKTFTTSFDGQRKIDIFVYEGNDKLCSNNSFIGSYSILGIPPAEKGSIIIDLTFQINSNGILNIYIDGKKNTFSDNCKDINYKLNDNIKLVPQIVAKKLFEQIFTKIASHVSK